MRSERVKRGKRSRRSKKSKRMSRAKRTKASRTKRPKRSRRTRVKRSRTRSRTRRTRRTRKSRRMRGGGALEDKKKEAEGEVDRLSKLNTGELKTLALGVKSSGPEVRDKLIEIQKKIITIYNIRIWIANNPENTPELIQWLKVLQQAVKQLDKLMSDGEVQVLAPRIEALKGASAAALIEDDSGNIQDISTWAGIEVASLEQAAAEAAALKDQIQKLDTKIGKLRVVLETNITERAQINGRVMLIKALKDKDSLLDQGADIPEIARLTTELAELGHTPEAGFVRNPE